MPKSNELTSNDRRVLEALQRASSPLSAHAILATLQSSPIRAPVQVYRSLRKLGRRGLAHRIEALNAYVACSGGHGDHRPAFAICRDCGSVSEFENKHTALLAKAALPGFTVEHVSLEVVGHCRDCQQARSQM
jgi:Fur family zinc uptake transcriptional regulator